jgi:hypothetical protein
MYPDSDGACIRIPFSSLLATTHSQAVAGTVNVAGHFNEGLFT